MKIKIPFLLLGACIISAFSGYAQTLTQTNLPILVITSPGAIGTSQMQANMKIINNMAGLNHPADAPQFQGIIGIRERGSASNPKKSYAVETWVASNGLSLDTSLLGMPSENDWVLLSSYTDRSLMRDLIGFHLFEQTGSWAPRMKLVEVILNNSYQGVYLFGEKIKKDVNRLDIASLQIADNSGQELTGGYILKIDNSTDGYWTSQFTPPFASSTQTIDFHYEEPEDGVITPVQQAYIKAWVDSFEAALNGPNFQDTSFGWRKFGAENSLEYYMMFSEVMKSSDAYRQATYLYKDKNKKLRVGPPWDLDNALYNNTDCGAANDTGWAYNAALSCPTKDYLPPFWWRKLTLDTAFMSEMKCRYTFLRNTALDTNDIFHFIDSINTYLNAEGAQTRNFQKWPIWGTALGDEPTPISANYNEEVSKIKGFLSRRITYLDAQWLTPGCVLAVPDVENLISGLSVYPNPVTDLLQVKFSLQQGAEVSMVLTDMYGRTVASKEMKHLGSGMHSVEFNTSQLVKGVYFLSATTGNSGKISTRVVKY
ncbi:MAG: T9SS type A sorting domain-containing protein [Sphingobacteriales bacterium]|nr:MAG: T9SS type A sorting domain-containing protein [Sphingobacteriales bacterium]